jgi:hypothetical protein
MAILGSAAFAAFQNKGDLALAEKLATEALRDGLAPDCPDPASAYAALVMSMTWTGRIEEGRARWREAFREFDRLGSGDYARAFLLQTAAAVGALTGDIHEARASAFQALDLARRVGSPSELANALWTASLTTVRDHLEQAFDLAEEAVSLIRAGASGAVLGHVLPIRAHLRARSGDGAGAVADLREAVLYSRDKGDTVMLVAGLEWGIVVFGALRRWQAVAVLAGAVNPRGPLGAVSTLPRAVRDDRAEFIERAQAELGQDAYGSAVARGEGMHPDTVVTYVIAELDREGAADVPPA